MAIKSQGTLLSVSTADGSSKTITAITAANPAVVTSTSHGLANGTIVYISGVVGMTEVNGRAFVVADTATNTFELAGVDSSGYTAYASGGAALPKTMTAVAEVVGFDGFDGTADSIDVTNLRSTAKEKLIGLQDFGQASFEVFLANTDTGQAKLRSLKAAGTAGTFTLTLTDSTVSAFMALVKSFPVQLQPNNAARGTIALEIASEPSWFA